MAHLRIGTVAARAGTNAPTIRYYEEVGLLRPAARQSSGQRTYDEADVKRLVFIRRCREFGFSIEHVRSLVGLTEDRRRSCWEARDLAQEHLGAVREKMRELRSLERSLIQFVTRCDSACAGGAGPDCVILEDLSKASEPLAASGRRSPRLNGVSAPTRRRRS